MASALEEIKEIEQETVEIDRRAAYLRAAIDRVITEERERASKLEALRDSLLEAPGQVLAMYKVTEVLTREMELEVATEVWQKTREHFRQWFESWSTLEKMNDPVIDGIVAHYAKVLERLISKADREYRAHAETLHLLRSPANAQRLAEALSDADAGRAREMTLEELRALSGGHST
jgi:hypothetical protein